MTPSQGRIVQYSLSSSDVQRIELQRFESSGQGKGDGETFPVLGNAVREGDTFPMMIVRVFGEAFEHSPVNGQVFLDGPDSLWVTSVSQGDGPQHWREPPRV